MRRMHYTLDIALRLSMAKVVALFNQSGGVGKSTLTMNLGYHLAKRKRGKQKQQVLLVDMDPQGSLTDFMGLGDKELDGTIAESLLEGQVLSIWKDVHKMDCIPADILLSQAEIQLLSAIKREYKLDKVLEPVKEEYDFILIDAPPSLGILSILSLVAADYLIVPIQTQYKCYRGTDLLLDTVEDIREANPKLAIAGIVPTMFIPGEVHEQRILAKIKEGLGDSFKVYAPIQKATAFKNASMANVPLAVYESKHPALKILDKIASDLMK